MRFNKDTCRSGRHAWTEENIKVQSNGCRVCRPCLLEKQREITRKRRALARTFTEAERIARLNLDFAYWPRVEKLESGCWIWRGCRDGEGYGYITFMSWPVSTHRIAYAIAKGPIGEGLEVCHSCDTPLCVNPDHLFTATHEENMRDMREKGRWVGFPNHYDENGNRKS